MTTRSPRVSQPCLTLSLALLRRPLSTTTTAPTPTQQQQQQQDQEQERTKEESSSSNSEARSTSWNPFRYFRLAFEWYARKLDSSPVLTQSLTSGFLFLIGDWTAQRYEHRLDTSKGIDVSQRAYLDLVRLAACTSFGLFVLGPFGHHWYSRLDVWTNRLYAPRTLKNVGLKVLLDTAIFNPIFLIVFFTVVSLLEGLTMNDIGRKLYRDFVPSYAVDCSVWPPIQTVNFRFVPVKFQLLVVNLGCYFDDVFLSYVQHNGMPAIFQSIEQGWLDWIGPVAAAGGHGHHHAVAATPAVADKVPVIEVLASTTAGATGERVMLVPASAEHPHHPHAHPVVAAVAGEPAAPMAHHHIVPRVLSETSQHHLSRGHGVDTQLVEELDADWATEAEAQADKAAVIEEKVEEMVSIVETKDERKQ